MESQRRVFYKKKKEKTDFGFVAFCLCKRIRKRVCAARLIHFYFRAELSPFPRENVSNECRKTALISFNAQKRVDRRSFPEDMHKLDSSTSCQRTKPFRAFPFFFFFFLAFQAFWTEKVKIEFENLIFLPVWWSSKRKKIPRERAHAQTATHTEWVPLSLSFFLSLSKCGPFPTWNRSDCDSIHPEVRARPRARIFGRDYACHQ